MVNFTLQLLPHLLYFALVCSLSLSWMVLLGLIIGFLLPSIAILLVSKRVSLSTRQLYPLRHLHERQLLSLQLINVFVQFLILLVYGPFVLPILLHICERFVA